MKVRVARRLPPSERVSSPPVSVSPGEKLIVVERDRHWDHFLLVDNAAGGRGWVPDRCLRVDGEVATVILPYDTTTLDPAPGDSLEVLDEDTEGGWYWCRDGGGNLGWFPVDHVRPSES
jgi:hypothetical protein